MHRWSLITWNIWASFVLGLIFMLVRILGQHVTLLSSTSLGLCVLSCALVALFALLRLGAKEWRAPNSRLRKFLGF
jgi:uncharacterized membrane protein